MEQPQPSLEQQPQIAQIPSQPSVPPPPHRSRKKFLLIGFVAVLILGIAGMLLIVNTASQKLKSATVPIPTQVSKEITPTVVPTVTVPKDANMKIYSFDGEKFILLGGYKSESNPRLFHTWDNNNSIYFISENTLYKFDLRTSSQARVSPVTFASGYGPGSVISDNNEVFYTTKALDYEHSQKVSVRLFDTTSNKETELTTIDPVIYGDAEYLFTSSAGQIIGSFGGDGCGGYGEIYRVTTSGNQELTKTGMGCNNNPRFIGSLPKEDSIILAELKQTPEEYSFEDYTFADGKINLMKVTSKVTTPLFDLSQIKGKVKNILLNDNKDILAILTKDSIYLFHIPTSTLDPALPNSGFTDYSIFVGDKLFGIDYESKNYKIFNVKSGEEHEIANTAFGIPEGLIPLGSYQGKFLLASYESLK